MAWPVDCFSGNRDYYSRAYIGLAGRRRFGSAASEHCRSESDLAGWRIFRCLNLLLFFTRPFAVKYINAHHEKTNYEGVIGKIVRVTETVNNLAQTGTAVVNGLEWTARAEKDEDVLEPGTLAKVVSISGVKLIVKKYEEE